MFPEGIQNIMSVFTRQSRTITVYSYHPLYICSTTYYFYANIQYTCNIYCVLMVGALFLCYNNICNVTLTGSLIVYAIYRQSSPRTVLYIVYIRFERVCNVVFSYCAFEAVSKEMESMTLIIFQGSHSYSKPMLCNHTP